MKNLITAIASIIILLVMIMQFVINQSLHDRLTRVDKMVFSFQQEIKLEGYISNERKKELESSISQLLKIGDGRVKVSGTREPVFRGEKISYSISFPLENMVSEFWGIKSDTDYSIKGSTTSELIDRGSNW